MEHEKFSGTAERFKEERERLGYSQASFAELGATKLRTLQNWEGAKNFPSSEFLAETAKYGVDITYILTGVRDTVPARFKQRGISGAVPHPANDDDVVNVPLYSATGSMGPGTQLLTEDVLLGDVPLSRQWLALHVSRSRHSALRMVHAYGDSMAGTLNSGDFAIVDTEYKDADVDGVYLLQANGQLFIKRVTRRMDGAHVITSDNPSVRTVDVLDGSQPVRICGRVVYGWNGRRF